ncbi:MAG: ligase-associated DNA damage response exonuclease [Rubinisphaera brasiliensis]|uniref:ligase-associated DNA damage response exonuclease n=1 Tax=Rubinisphaera TaxID=1649490 RepID=UPI001F4872E8|nr:ligase-associated DNA damage response exonuclease [Rubinisphaera sp. JC750]
MQPLLVPDDCGLYCAAGDFHIDPWRPVEKAVITHAHGDHARYGSQKYIASPDSLPIMKKRLGESTNIATLPYGETQRINGVTISLHPAGHVLGSAQIRVEHQGEVWVASGDYKLEPDRTCTPFEPIRCHTFITESTFGLPLYHWPDQQDVFRQINSWWSANADEGRPSIVFAYSFGKAQRVLSGLDASIGPIYCHGAVEALNQAYREQNVALPETEYAGRSDVNKNWGRAMILAPPSAQTTTWLKKFGNYASAFASGWMTVRGQRRRRNVEKGFILSDHADWPGLLEAIKATEADCILATHGYRRVLVRYLQEQGWEAGDLDTHYEGEQDDQPDLEPVTAGEADEA